MGWELSAVADYKTARLDSPDVEQALNAIERAVLVSEFLVRDIAEKHLVAFRADMFERFGAEDVPPGDEPYLEAEIARFQLQFLQTITRLTEQLERKIVRALSDKKDWTSEARTSDQAGAHPARRLSAIENIEPDYEDKSGIDSKFPLAPQVEERIAWATHLLRERMERALDEKRQRASGIEKYVWHTMDDDRVRPSHAANDGLTFRWDLKPATGHPGEDFGCRCWAEPVAEGGKLPDDPPIEPVFPEQFLIPLLRLRPAIIAAARGLYTLARDIRKLVSKPRDTSTERVTGHGSQRMSQRSITDKQIEDAIKSAKKTGNVTVRKGKYGTQQTHYKGTNGVTVVIETSG